MCKKIFMAIVFLFAMSTAAQALPVDFINHVKPMSGCWNVEQDNSSVTWYIRHDKQYSSVSGNTQIAYGYKNPGNVEFVLLWSAFLGIMDTYLYNEKAHDLVNSYMDLPSPGGPEIDQYTIIKASGAPADAESDNYTTDNFSDFALATAGPYEITSGSRTGASCEFTTTTTTGTPQSTTTTSLGPSNANHLRPMMGNWDVNQDSTNVTWSIRHDKQYISDSGNTQIAYGYKNPGNMEFILLWSAFMGQGIYFYLEKAHDQVNDYNDIPGPSELYLFTQIHAVGASPDAESDNYTTDNFTCICLATPGPYAIISGSRPGASCEICEIIEIPTTTSTVQEGIVNHLHPMMGEWNVEQDNSSVTWSIRNDKQYISDSGATQIAYGYKNPGNVEFILFWTPFIGQDKYFYLEKAHDQVNDYNDIYGQNELHLYTQIHAFGVSPDAESDNYTTDNFTCICLATPGPYAITSGSRPGASCEISTTTTTTEIGQTTTTSISQQNTTTTISTTATTTIPGKIDCPITKVLGEDNPRLQNLRSFRDSTLATSTAGRMIINIYYGNAESINAALDRNPMLKALAKKVLERIALDGN